MPADVFLQAAEPVDTGIDPRQFTLQPPAALAAPMSARDDAVGTVQLAGEPLLDPQRCPDILAAHQFVELAGDQR